MCRYICAGHVHLPQAYAQCPSKDQLWHSVKKGLRPEWLDSFDPECWTIMRQSWSDDPAMRPLLGDVQPRLQVHLICHKIFVDLLCINLLLLSKMFINNQVFEYHKIVTIFKQR